MYNFSIYGGRSSGLIYSQDYNNPINYGVSGLEQKVQYTIESQIIQPQQNPRFYTIVDSYKKTNHYQPHKLSYLAHEAFLKPTRPKTKFVQEFNEVRENVSKTFELVTGKKMRKNLSIEIMPEEEFIQLTNERAVLGLAINSNGKGESIILIKENNLDLLMLVIGHEIGHILTNQLKNKQDEEAKAFAFQMEWVRTIFENNVAGLRKSINGDIFTPAENGLHNVAFNFVKKIKQKGVSPLELHALLSTEVVGVNNYSIINF